MKTLLEKTRKINKLLQKAAGNPVDFDEMAQALHDTIECNCYIVGRQGRILGYAFVEGFACEMMDDIIYRHERFPEDYNEELLRNSETIANFVQQQGGCLFGEDRQCHFQGKLVTVVPIVGGGQRLGTLVLAKFNEEFNEGDLVLAEYGATVVGMEILRSKAERIEEETTHPITRLRYGVQSISTTIFNCRTSNRQSAFLYPEKQSTLSNNLLRGNPAIESE